MTPGSFPEGFLWRAATAAHEVEGGNAGNDGRLLEHVPGTCYAEPSGDACDHYRRLPEDIALIAGLGLGSPTLRFSGPPRPNHVQRGNENADS